MSRALSKDGRKAILEQLAAKRKMQQRQNAVAYRDLEGSESSEEESFTTGRSKPVTVLDGHSSEEEKKGPAGAVGKPPGAGSTLNRLRKAGAVPLPQPPQQLCPVVTTAVVEDDDDVDITAQMGGLAVEKGKSAGRGNPSAPTAPPARSRLDLARSQHTEPGREESPESSEQNNNCLVLGERGQFRLNAKASTMLYPHQVEGVKWLWSLWCLKSGGILADDMGLGKTIQCAAFLAGLIENRLIRRAIVVAPKTLLAQWRKELGVCGLQSRAHEYDGTPGQRAATLGRVMRQRGVLLTTYGMLLHNAEVLAQHEDHDPDDGPMWDVMICDEGHKLKNPRMQLRKALDELPVQLRVIISGTPIQNNLMEMWALFNFCAPDVLGEPADFRDRYEKVVTIGSDKHATEYERERGAVAAARLRQEIAPYMLRREKKEVFKPAAADCTAQSGVDPSATQQAEGAAQAGPGCAKPATMPHKNDLIVWLKLKPMQLRVYQAFLNSDSVKKVFNQTASALAAITVLKKVCDHPALLSERAAHGIVSGVNRARRQAAARLGGAGSADEIEDSSDSDGSCIEFLDSEEEDCESGSEDYSSGEERERQRRRRAKPQRLKTNSSGRGGKDGRGGMEASGGAGGEEEWSLWASADLEQRLLEEVHTTGFGASCKTVFVMGLLHNLVAEGHRTLIFSQSRVMLNILESAITEEGWRYCRIDGSVASAAEREARVRRFQTSSSIPVFLLTSQVGGLGLTLTAADRVIILDPAWNPSTDNQSVDRAYRIGQQRDVVVYRLISCGTVEEKIYRRQVFKGGLSRTGMEEGEQLRYFAQQDLRDLFRLEATECEASRTQHELHDRHAHQRRETPELTRHLAFLANLDCFAGVSDHDLLFSIKEKEAPPPVTDITRPTAPARAAGPGSHSVAAPSGGSARKQGPGRPGSVFGKTATQGWSGSSELADLFAKSVTISGGSGGSAAVAAAAQPPGSSQPSPAAPAPLQESPKISTQERVADLEAVLVRKRNLLALSSGLADGGARVRSQIAELERELADVKQQASVVSSSRTATTGSALVPAGAAASDQAPVNPAATEVAAAPTAELVRSLGAAPPKLGGTRSSSGMAAALPAKPAGSSVLLAATAAALIGKSSGGPSADGSLKPALPLQPKQPAAAATVCGAPAAASLPAPPAATATAGPSKAPASPFLTRMRDMLWGGGSSKKSSAAPGGSAADSVDAAVDSQAAATTHSHGASGSASSIAITDKPASTAAAAAPEAAAGIVAAAPLASAGAFINPAADGYTASGSGSAGAAPIAAGAAAAGVASGVQAQQGKPQLSRKEIKAKLMKTLQAIKAAESSGYFQRDKVDKMRQQAARLAQRYKEAKRSDSTDEGVTSIGA